MPTYDYCCDRCGNGHSEFKTMSAPHPAACPSCGEPWGESFRQDFAGVGAVAIVYGNPTTFGQQAEINARREGKERLQMMQEEARRRVSRWSGPLPEGARVNTTGTGETPWFRAPGTPGLKPLDKPLDLSAVKDVRRYVETGN